jgi:hypothetical protein
VEMKRLFSIASKDGTEGEVTEVIVAVFRAGFAGVRRWLRRRQTLVPRLVAYPRSRAAEGGDGRGGAQATDASGVAPRGFRPYWTASVERRTCGLRTDGRVC